MQRPSAEVMSSGLLRVPAEILAIVSDHLTANDLGRLSSTVHCMPAIANRAARRQSERETGLPYAAVLAMLQLSPSSSAAFVYGAACGMATKALVPFSEARVTTGAAIGRINVGGQGTHPSFGPLPPQPGDSWELFFPPVRRGSYVLAAFGGANPYHGILAIEVWLPWGHHPLASYTGDRRELKAGVGEMDWFDRTTVYPSVRTLSVQVPVSGPVKLYGTTQARRNDSSLGYWICLNDMRLVEASEWATLQPNFLSALSSFPGSLQAPMGQGDISELVSSVYAAL